MINEKRESMSSQTFEENRRAVGILNPMRENNSRHVPGGRRGDTCDKRLVQNIDEGKTSNELGWEVKVLIQK